MSYLDVYIGRLDDPHFSWEGGNWNGNVPHAISPRFPEGRTAFWELIKRIESGELDGKQTDWGGWVARVTKAQIEEFIRDIHDAHPWYQSDSPMPHMKERLDALRGFVATLKDDEKYALIASEL